MRVSKNHAFLRFRAEEGAHVFLDEEKNAKRAQIRAFDSSLEETWCEMSKMVRPDFKALPVRRQFEEAKETYKDSALAVKERGAWNAETIAELIDRQLQGEAESQL